MTSRPPTSLLAGLLVATSLLSSLSCSANPLASDGASPSTGAASPTDDAEDADDADASGTGTASPATGDDHPAANPTAPGNGTDTDTGVGPATWTPCPPDGTTGGGTGAGANTGFECATVAVPLDHAEPDGELIEIAMVRLPATGERLGSIFVNPGGPGASGTGFVQGGFRFDRTTMASYDLVGFDPRGIGASSPLTCFADRTDGPLPDFSPDTPAEERQLDDTAGAIAESCATTDAAILDHLTTEAVVHDLDLLRQAVGDDRLHYYGFSYGTLIGLVYADEFPDLVGHLVLDGVVDPASSLGDLLGQQAEGFDAAFASLDATCTQLIACPDGGVAAAYDRTLASLEASGPVGQVGPAELELAALSVLYSERQWSAFTTALTTADSGDLRAIKALSDSLVGSVSATAYLAVVCSDLAHPTGPEAWDAFADDLAATSDRFGAALANEVRACAHWPVGPGEPRQPIDAQTAAPVLVIGTTGDPATLLSNAETVASTLGNARLIVHEGNRHTAYAVSGCVQSLIRDYFIDDRAPSATVACAA